MSIENGIGKTKHPSYGQLQINRVSSNKRVPLYGTANECRDTIQLSIHTSVHNRDLNRDWHFADTELIEVEMSPAQFAEAITSLNMGSGTPCTIRRLRGADGSLKRIEDPPYKADRDLFDKEFNSKLQETMADMEKLIAQASEISDKKSITKKDMAQLIGQLNGIRQEIVNNMPFVAKSFSEHMGNVVSSAKIEFESFVEGKLRSTGMEALREWAPKNNLLESSENQVPESSE